MEINLSTNWQILMCIKECLNQLIKYINDKYLNLSDIVLAVYPDRWIVKLLGYSFIACEVKIFFQAFFDFKNSCC